MLGYEYSMRYKIDSTEYDSYYWILVKPYNTQLLYL